MLLNSPRIQRSSSLRSQGAGKIGGGRQIWPPLSCPTCPGQLIGGKKLVDVGVDGEKTGDVPEPQQKLGDALLDRLLAVANGSPRRLVGKKIPAQRVGPVLVEYLTGGQIIPLALGHFLPIFPQHQSQDDAVPKRVRVGSRPG